MVKPKKRASKIKSKKEQHNRKSYTIAFVVLAILILVGIVYTLSFNTQTQTQKADNALKIAEKVGSALSSKELAIDRSNSRRLDVLTSLIQVEPTSIRSIKYYKCAFDSIGGGGWTIKDWDQYCNVRNISVLQTSESLIDIVGAIDNERASTSLGALRKDAKEVGCGAITGSTKPNVRLIFATSHTTNNQGWDCDFLQQDNIIEKDYPEIKIKVINSFDFSTLDKTKNYIILDYSEEFFRESIGCNNVPISGCKPAFDAPVVNF